MLEAVLRPLESLLGASWGPLGALGASCGLLGNLLGFSGGPLGAQGSKCPFGSLVWAPSWSRLGGLLGRIGGLLGLCLVLSLSLSLLSSSSSSPEPLPQWGSKAGQAAPLR